MHRNILVPHKRDSLGFCETVSAAVSIVKYKYCPAGDFSIFAYSQARIVDLSLPLPRLNGPVRRGRLREG